MLELKVNPNKKAKGTVIETSVEKGRGSVATVLIQDGTLRIGENFAIGKHYGKVRAMFDHLGRRVKEAPPSTPVEIIGLSGLPQAGDLFVVFDSEKEAREYSLRKTEEEKAKSPTRIGALRYISKDKETKEFYLIIKADLQGSLEAIINALEKLQTEQLKIKIIHEGIGEITESDVMLASTVNACILGFGVRVSSEIQSLAEKQRVDIRIYNVIYDLIDETKMLMEGLIEPEYKQITQGELKVKEIFKISKVGTVAGCQVVSGKITRKSLVRLYRDGIMIYEGRVNSLRRFSEDVLEVAAGLECGLSLVDFQDIKKGDVIEAYILEEIKKKIFN
jgi:translation initiation factor IF-2